jgi:hypothetical protein
MSLSCRVRAMRSACGPISAAQPTGLDRAGDRDLNCALHTIVFTRLQHDPATHERDREEGSMPVKSSVR